MSRAALAYLPKPASPRLAEARPRTRRINTSPFSRLPRVRGKPRQGVKNRTGRYAPGLTLKTHANPPEITPVAHKSVVGCSVAAETAGVDVAASGSARLRYMGGTPDKFSRTGAEVVERMRGDGLIVGDGPLLRGNPNILQLVTGSGLVRIDSTIDMAHQVDAVSWWNSTGRFYGAKAPEVRQFMLDSKNYILQPSSINRSEGAMLRQTYLPPEPPTFTTLKR